MEQCTNLECVRQVVEYVEAHLLGEPLDLERIAAACGYSKYHLHRMFSAVAGMPLHAYIQRRRLTEAARLLAAGQTPLAQLAFLAGYQTQQAFATGFKSLYHCSPRAFRRRGQFLPVQLPLQPAGPAPLQSALVLRVEQQQSGPLLLAGVHGHTRHGFWVIGRCWHRLHAQKNALPGRVDPGFLVGVNDYSGQSEGDEPHHFVYWAAAEIAQPQALPRGFELKRLPAGRYLVFCLRGNSKASMQPVAEYVYRQWMPQAACRLDPAARFDLVRYGEAVDEKGQSEIEYWVPIL